MDEHTLAVARARGSVLGMTPEEYVAAVVAEHTDRAREGSRQFADDFHRKWRGFFVEIGDAPP